VTARNRTPRGEGGKLRKASRRPIRKHTTKRATKADRTPRPRKAAKPIKEPPEWASLTVNQRRFLTAYAECGNITRAAAVAKITRRPHYDWLAAEPDYVRAFKEAGDTAADRLVEEARRRAMVGSDVLLIFLLKGLRPETYRDNHHLTFKGKVDSDVRTNAPPKLTDEQERVLDDYERDVPLSLRIQVEEALDKARQEREEGNGQLNGRPVPESVQDSP
jgi:hypothetical protein